MVASSKVVFSTTKGHKVEESMPTAFGFAASDVGSREITLGEWRDNFLDFQNWSRLNVLMALSSYFENYIQSISNLALESNPGILFKTPKVLDGTIMLKMEQQHSFANETFDLVKGSWTSRESAFRNLFGNCPASLSNNIGELEKVRSIRNGIGHAFGRTLNTKELLSINSYQPMERVSEKRLKKWLGLVFMIAHDIDEFLLVEHIGAYELIKYYHHWHKKSGYHMAGRKDPNNFRKLNIRGFIRYFHDELMPAWGGPYPEHEYLKELIDYYGG